MRLGAHAQPADIRMTRRRSVLPRPSSSISREETRYRHLENNGHDNDPLVRLDKGRSISAARLHAKPSLVSFSALLGRSLTGATVEQRSLAEDSFIQTPVSEAKDIDHVIGG